jgi:hypothetical protein
LYVPLDDDTLQKLGRIARRERRHPKDSASLLLERAINDAEPEPARTPQPADRDDDRASA